MAKSTRSNAENKKINEIKEETVSNVNPEVEEMKAQVEAYKQQMEEMKNMMAEMMKNMAQPITRNAIVQEQEVEIGTAMVQGIGFTSL